MTILNGLAVQRGEEKRCGEITLVGGESACCRRRMMVAMHEVLEWIYAMLSAACYAQFSRCVVDMLFTSVL